MPFGTGLGVAACDVGADISCCACWAGVIEVWVLLRLNMLDMVRLKLGALLLVDRRDKGDDVV